MKRLLSALAAATLFAASLGATAAHAAKEEKPAAPAGYKDDQLKKGAEGAPAAVKAVGLNCTIKNAAQIGGGTVEGPDKKKINGTSYEVACAEGMGFVVLKYDKQDGGQSYSCIDLQKGYDDAIAAKKAAGPRCLLPENSNLNAQIQPVVTKAGAKCTASAVNPLGHDPKNNVTNYEVACSEGTGYIIRSFDNGQASATNCLQAAVNLHYECKLTAQPQRIAGISAIAVSLDKSCQVADGRYVGTTTDKHDLYEIGCNGKAGFFLDIYPDGSAKTMDCLAAQNIGGGCKMTDVGKVKASAAGSYTDVLKANGVTCTASDFHVVGKEPRTNRDVVEFKCPERPTGLMALIVGAGATGKFEKMDCIDAKARVLDCTLTTKPEMLAQLKLMAANSGVTCDPTDYRTVSPDEGDGEVVEVKCAAGGGYLLDLPLNRQKAAKHWTCAEAAKGDSDKCALPGNT